LSRRTPYRQGNFTGAPSRLAKENFIGLGVERTGEFLHQIRRAPFFTLCRQFLDHEEPMPLEPFPIALKSTDVMAGAMR
jgi:hypothetical protein